MLNIGVLGAGHLGKIHLRLWKEVEGVNVIGFYDSDGSKSQQVAKESGIRSFSSMHVLLEQCDVIDIVTPTLTHYSLAAEAIKKSKHVFIEKPVTATVHEADKLIALAREANVKAQVGHIERFNPAFAVARPYLNNPMFIETHRLAEFNPRGTDVSVVHDLMIHDIDIVLSVVRSPVKKISASGVAVVSDTPDIANARIEFDNGCVANLTASRMSMKNMRKSRFFQHNAYISVDFLAKKSEIIRLKNLDGEPGPLDIVIDLGEKGRKQIYFESPEVGETNALKNELESFVQCILNDTIPAITLEDGHHALKVAHSVAEKLKYSTAFSV
ncbi:MAG: Gfo/Idh/MocA family oxidoreductase [Bacteroidia bacterium]|nr:Gfo/Idh/MocA family oxidoreductase [Bacteroidia bacterium]